MQQRDDQHTTRDVPTTHHTLLQSPRLNPGHGNVTQTLLEASLDSTGIDDAVRMRTHCSGQVKNFVFMTGEMGHTPSRPMREEGLRRDRQPTDESGKCFRSPAELELRSERLRGRDGPRFALPTHVNVMPRRAKLRGAAVQRIERRKLDASDA